MKRFKDFFIGLVLGILYFFGVSLFTDVTPVFFPFWYHIIALAIALGIYLIIFKKLYLIRTLFFAIGFFLPTLIWFLLVLQAIGNFQVL